MKLTIDQYAKKCKLTRQAVYNRIGAKWNGITPIIDNSMGYPVQLIDTDIYPPLKKQKAGRKKFIAKS